MAPSPPDPPSRQLVIENIDGKPTIVWRGGIPSVHVPRRLDLDPPEDLPTTATTNGSPKQVQPASRDPSQGLAWSH